MNKYVKEFLGIFKNTQKHLMNGVSYMIPVVVAGGILFAIATMILGPQTINEIKDAASVPNSLGGALYMIGKCGLSLMVVVLSAYIAESIADRPGIAPGLIGGLMCVSDITSINAGFIGGIFSGLIAGISAYYLKKIPLPKAARSLKAVIIVPILATLITGILILFVIGAPCAWLLTTLSEWLQTVSQSGAGAAAVGAICGAMIAFDMGGPVNKVAYSTGVALVGTSLTTGQNCLFMGPIGVAICIPPIGCGIASLIFKNKFTAQERSNGIGAIIMGFCGITEGAIPYATADPIRLIPINMIASAIAGGLAGFLGAWSNAAWGGLIVLPVTNMLPYFVSIAVGVAIHVVLCGLIKKNKNKTDAKDKTKANAESSPNKDAEQASTLTQITVLGVTACPSGVAHTYMSAEALSAACEKLNVKCKVETQGSIGVENVLNDEEIASATAIILTNNMPIKNSDRFEDSKVVETEIGHLIKNAEEIVQKIIDEAN